MAHLLTARYSPAASTQRQARMANALLMVPTRSRFTQDILFNTRLERLRSRMGELNFGKFTTKRQCAESPFRRQGGRFGGTKGGIDPGLHTARGKRRQPRLGSAGFDLVADLETPLPNVGLRGRHDGVFDALINHSVFSSAQKRQGQRFRTSINPWHYGMPMVPAAKDVGLPCLGCRRVQDRASQIPSAG